MYIWLNQDDGDIETLGLKVARNAMRALTSMSNGDIGIDVVKTTLKHLYIRHVQNVSTRSHQTLR